MSVNALIKDETIWLTQKGVAELFGVGILAISKHLKNIFDEQELDEKVVISIMEITTRHGAMNDKQQKSKHDFIIWMLWSLLDTELIQKKLRILEYGQQVF